MLLRSPTQARLLVLYLRTRHSQLTLNVITSTDSTDSVTQRFLYSPFTKAFYTKKVHAELEALLTGPPEDFVMKPAAIHKGVRTKPRNRSIVAGREPLGLFEPNGPHFPQGA